MTEDPSERLDQFVEWGNEYASEKGFMRLYSLLFRPMLVACHPYGMRKILKTAGK